MNETFEITGHTRVVGVWGHPVSHSRSPRMQNAAFRALGLDWVYTAFDVAPEQVRAAVEGIRALGLIGVNVTVPLKELVLPYLDWIDPEAAQIGAVNTIHNVEGELRGYSTDGAGFLHALGGVGETVRHRNVLLLGAGGSARAVAFALAAAGATVWIANRTQERAQTLVDRVNCTYPKAAIAIGWGSASGPCDLIVNATALGMAPRIDETPMLPPGMPHSGQFVYDLIYAPPETELLKRARAQGCRTENGLTMLAAQGALALSIWTGRPLSEMPISLMETALKPQVAADPRV